VGSDQPTSKRAGGVHYENRGCAALYTQVHTHWYTCPTRGVMHWASPWSSLSTGYVKGARTSPQDTDTKVKKRERRHSADRFDSSIVDVPDETNEAQCENAVRRRPFDRVALDHCDVVRSTQVRLHTATVSRSVPCQLSNLTPEYLAMSISSRVLEYSLET